jgi:hypothetical protein
VASAQGVWGGDLQDCGLRGLGLRGHALGLDHALEYPTTAVDITRAVRVTRCTSCGTCTMTSYAVDTRSQRTARAGNRRFGPLSALRAHTKAPYKMDFNRKTLRALNGPGTVRTVAVHRVVAPADRAAAAARALTPTRRAAMTSRARDTCCLLRVLYSHYTSVEFLHA